MTVYNWGAPLSPCLVSAMQSCMHAQGCMHARPRQDGMKLCWCPLAWRIAWIAGVMSWLAGVKSWRPSGISNASYGLLLGYPPYLCTHACTRSMLPLDLSSDSPPQVDAASGPEL